MVKSLRARLQSMLKKMRNTFHLSNEAYKALNDWMDYHKQCGEIINENSWIMRNLWDVTTPKGKGIVTVPKKQKSTGVKRLIERALWAQELQQKPPSPAIGSLPSTSPIRSTSSPPQQEQQPAALHAHEPVRIKDTSSSSLPIKEDKREEYYYPHIVKEEKKRQQSWISPKILIPIIIAAVIGSVIAFAVFSTTPTPPPETEQQKLQKQRYSFVRAWGSNGTKDGQFYEPMGISIDSQNNVYITDYGNDRIQVFAPTM